MIGPKRSYPTIHGYVAHLLLAGLFVCLSGCGIEAPPTSNGKTDGADSDITTGDGVGGNCTDPVPHCATWPMKIMVGEGDEAKEIEYTPGANGICADKVGVAVCEGTEWVCTFEGVDLAVNDAVCDGLDSDCDGVPDDDETPLVDIPSCEAGLVGGALKGVCEVVQVECGDDLKPKCDFAALEDYVADEGFDSDDLGRWCDGLDNDCDGEPDEGMISDKGYEGLVATANFEFDDCPELTGVCGGKVSSAEGYTGALMLMCDKNKKKLQCAYACGGGFPAEETCNYNEELAASGYEAEETSCDGLDNDCDGLVDDVFDVEASGCPYQGVCAGKVEAICKDIDDSEEYVPGWVCIFDSSIYTDPSFEYQDLAACEGEPGCGAESTCDGLDNDCDGLVDEGLVWPLECFTQFADGTVDYHCDDEDLPQCAQYYPKCAEAEALAFEDCPVQEKQAFDGVNAWVPVLADDGSPLLPGVCEPDADGVSSVRYSCVPLSVDTDEEPETNVWACNYDLVESYNASEATDDSAWCDGLDNNCDTVPDGELKPNGNIVYIKALKASVEVPCRTLGACAGNWEATCNKDGKNPGKWSCKYDSDAIEMVDPNNPECDPGYANCIWAETLCDGLDNDCDGLEDELLDGFKVDLDAACADVMDVGVCNLDSLNTTCTDVDGGKGFACDFTAVEYYAPVEESVGVFHRAELCDGRDNDCDGETDEAISFYSPTLHEEFATGCGSKGVCAAGTKGVCAPADPAVPGEANWDCDYSGLGAAYKDGQVSIQGVSTEVYCDGLDNDCDGLIDEGLSADLIGALEKNPKVLSGCPQKGICAGVMKWNCDVVDGESSWVCDASDVGLSYEVIETRCDGIDNDCDGAADEELGDPGPNGAQCKSLGVCAEGGVTAACIDQAGKATWLCYYDEVVSYDGLVETTCDGQDNDCDGFIDEDLDWEASNACSKQGVCDSPLLDAECNGDDGWYCVYVTIPEYEEEEETCDQMDNDCDGTIDELTCGICEPCVEASYCTSGVCSAVPAEQGEGVKFCSYSSKYCVYIDPYSEECDFVNTNEYACADEKTPKVCGDGTWFPQAACTGQAPVCWDGECKVCVPGSKSCDGNNVKSCSAGGTGWAVEKICGEGTVCIGDGACVVNSEFAVSTVNLSSQQSINVDPKIASSTGGGFAVVYTARSFPGGAQTDVLWRRYSSQIAAVGVQEDIVNEVTGGDQSSADIDNFPRDEGGYVVVWQDSNAPGEDASGWDVVAQILPESGPAALPDTDTRILVNSTTAGDQTSPSVVAMADGTFMVAWEQDSGAIEEPEIFAQRFKTDGTKYGDEFQINTYVPGDQRYPVLARRSNMGVVAGWASNLQVNGWDVFTKRFNKSFVEEGTEMLVNKTTNSLQSYPAAAGFGGVKAGAYVVAWEGFGKDSSSLGVSVNLFDVDGKAENQEELLVNKLVQGGSQRDPAVAVLEDNHFVVVWETPGLGIDNDQEGIAYKVYDADGVELQENEALVNENIGGKQTNADVAAIPGNGYVVVWLSNPGGDNYSIRGRVFKVEE